MRHPAAFKMFLLNFRVPSNTSCRIAAFLILERLRFSTPFADETMPELSPLCSLPHLPQSPKDSKAPVMLWTSPSSRPGLNPCFEFRLHMMSNREFRNSPSPKERLSCSWRLFPKIGIGTSPHAEKCRATVFFVGRPRRAIWLSFFRISFRVFKNHWLRWSFPIFFFQNWTFSMVFLKFSKMRSWSLRILKEFSLCLSRRRMLAASVSR